MASLMKGNKWHERCDATDRKGNPIVTYPVMAEIKHDEIRCHVRIDRVEGSVQFISYAGKPLANMQQFDILLLALAAKTGYNEFDCGFECNGNFNDSYRWVRSTKGIPADLNGKEYRFYLFDLPTLEVPYHQRRQIVLNLCRNCPWLHSVTGWMCSSKEEVEERFNYVRSCGYEGLMIKALDGLYLRGKRTDGWLKMKPSDDATGKLVGIQEAISIDGVCLGRAGSVRVAMEDGSVAQPAGIAHALGVDMWEHPDKYLGLPVEFTYMERDRAGGYRHPAFLRFALEV